jgi:HK97 family phage portal protein
MKLFGWKSAGRAQSRPAHLSVPLATQFRPFGEWPQSYEAQVREGYLHNAVAQRAVRLVAEGVASVPLVASDEAARALVMATSGGQALLETLATQLLLHGNGYVQLLSGVDGAPVELYALRPERVSVEGDVRGWPVGFQYRAGQVATRLGADEVIHIRSHHPLDDHYGLGCLGAASGAIAVHNASAKWNKALLDNAARPSGALISGGGEPLSGEQFERLKTELAAGYQGAVNAGRPMLLEGGLSWQSLSLSPADMDFAGLKAAAAREIALAFGVPPMLLGMPGDATYANYREANKALWRQAILPLSGKILGAIAQGLRPWFSGLTLEVDLDQVTALSEDRERLWAQLGAAEFMTLNEKRAAVGLEALELGEPDDDAEAGDDAETDAGKVEAKFNPWHDPEHGRFTFVGQGVRALGSAISIISTSSRGRRARKGPEPRTGGSFGGGGATGSWDSPQPAKPRPKVAKPTRPAAKPRQGRIKPKILNRLPDVSIRRSAPNASTSSPPLRRETRNGYDYDIDEKDRTRRVLGILTLEPSQGRSKRNQLAAGGPDRLPVDQGGHYIAREFNGPTDKFNHFAQNATFNKSEYRKLELQWKGLIEKGSEVNVDITPRYEGLSQRPETISVTYHVDGERHYKTFLNAKKGE